MHVRFLLRAVVLLALVATLLLAGCVLPTGPVGVNDPPWQSPYARPLNTYPAPSAGPVQAGRPPSAPTVPPGAAAPTTPFPSNNSAPRNAPQLTEPRTTLPRTTTPQPSDRRPGGTGDNGFDSLPESDPNEQGSLRRSDRPSDRPADQPGGPALTPIPPRRPANAESPNSTDSRGQADSSAPPGGTAPRQPELRVTPSPVGLSIDAPRSAGVGEPVTFDIELTNATDRTLEDVRVDCEFDDDLDFSGKPDKRVERTFEELAAGERAVFRLTLTPLKPGRHCCGFSAALDGKEQIRRNVCVDAIPRPVGLRLAGPKSRMQGARAEFTVKVVNLSGKPQQKARLFLRSESALRPFEWSQGGEQRDGGLHWDLGTLQAGEGVQLQIEYDCVQASEETELAATITLGDGTTIDESTRVTVVPRNSDLRVDLTDDRDPLAVGEETTIELTVANVGLRAVEGLAIELLLPAALDFGEVEAALDGRPFDVAAKTNGGLVNVTLPRALPVDGRLSLRWKAKATGAGDVRTQATFTAPALDASIVVDEATTVTPARTARRR